MIRNILLLLVFVSSLNLVLKQDEDIIQINLEEEMNRKEYLISQNQTIKFIQSNEAFIYIIEIPKNSEIIDEQNNTIKDISYLSSLNSHKTLHLKNDAIKEKKIYVTSVANNIEISFTDKVNGHSNYLFPRNGIIFFYSKENEEKILNLDSFENSFLFYYY